MGLCHAPDEWRKPARIKTRSSRPVIRVLVTSDAPAPWRQRTPNCLNTWRTQVEPIINHRTVVIDSRAWLHIRTLRLMSWDPDSLSRGPRYSHLDITPRFASWLDILRGHSMIPHMLCHVYAAGSEFEASTHFGLNR